MIQTQTFLKLRDNSGAQEAKCIKILGGFKRRYAKLGDIIIVSLRKLRIKNRLPLKVKKRQVIRGIIIRVNYKFCRIPFKSIKLFENSIILLNKKYKPLGTRIIGKIPKEVRKKKLMRLVSISAGII